MSWVMGLQDPFPIPLTRSSVSAYPVVIPAPAFAAPWRQPWLSQIVVPNLQVSLFRINTHFFNWSKKFLKGYITSTPFPDEKQRRREFHQLAAFSAHSCIYNQDACYSGLLWVPRGFIFSSSLEILSQYRFWALFLSLCLTGFVRL